jgi:hypothetical protein
MLPRDVLGWVGVVGLIGWGAAASAEPMAARSAEAMVDSIGVNVHLHYTDTPYTSYDEATRAVRFGEVYSALEDSGIRHVRDAMLDTAFSPYYEQHNALHTELGISATLVMDRSIRNRAAWDQPVDLRTDEELLALLLEVAGRFDGLEAVGGYNEPDGPVEDDSWVAPTRADQRVLFETFDGTLPVLGPPLTNWESYAELGDLSSQMHVGAFHPYPGGRAPELGIGTEIARQTPISGSLGLQATETGYHTAAGSGHSQPGVSEAVQAVYLPRLYMEYFRLGVERTFAYELLDTLVIDTQAPDDSGQESNFGLVRDDYSRRPAFDALARLIGLLEGESLPDASLRSASASSGASLDVELVSDLGDELRHVLLAGEDGVFYLAVWRAVEVADDGLGGVSVVGADAVGEVGLTFAEPMAVASVFTPSSSADPLTVERGVSRLDLSLGGELVVVQLQTVPEPGVAGLVLAGGGLMGWGRRRG